MPTLEELHFGRGRLLWRLVFNQGAEAMDRLARDVDVNLDLDARNTGRPACPSLRQCPREIEQARAKCGDVPLMMHFDYLNILNSFRTDRIRLIDPRASTTAAPSAFSATEILLARSVYT